MALIRLSSCGHVTVSALGAVGWSAVCDCGIYWSYSLTFYSEKKSWQRITPVTIILAY